MPRSATTSSKILILGSGPDRHRPGRRVRLLRRAGLQGPARGGLRGRPGQLQPGDDHDRPGVRRRDLRRAAAARARSPRSSSSERPDALLPTLGGQTALNLAKALHEDGTLERFGVELIGANYDAIDSAEDRELFRDGDGARRAADAARARSPRRVDGGDGRAAREIGLPAIVRPAFTLGGRGGGIARTREEFQRSSPAASPPRRSARCCSTSRCSAGASSSSR